MTTLAVDSPLTMVTGEFNSIGAIADDIVFEGAMVGENASGYGRPLVAGDLFLGHSLLNVDNTDGAAGAKEIRLRTGRYRGKVTLTGVLITDVGKEVYASDDDTYTLSSAGNTRVGVVIRYDSSNKAIVEFQTNEPFAESEDAFKIYGDLLVGGSYQGIHEASDTQNYDIGIRRVDLIDGETRHYAKAGATLNCDLGCEPYNTQHVAYTTLAESALAEATSVVIDVAGGDGVLADGAIGLNELKNGYLVVFPHSDNSFVRRITGNTATTGAGEMTLTLAYPIPVALTLNVSHCECMASPFLDIRSGSSATKSIIAQPDVAATIGQFLWVKTDGVFWIAPHAEVSVGNNNRQTVFRHDGSLDEVDCDDANVDRAQRFGYVLANAAGGGQGAPFVKGRF